MARLSKHGSEIVRIHYLSKDVSYCSDGTILQNNGSGWRIKGKVKPGVDIVNYARSVEETFKNRIASEPEYAHLRKLLFDAASGLARRTRILVVLDLLGSDIDGAWSELNDFHGIKLTLDEVKALASARSDYLRVLRKTDERTTDSSSNRATHPAAKQSRVDTLSSLLTSETPIAPTHPRLNQPLLLSVPRYYSDEIRLSRSRRLLATLTNRLIDYDGPNFNFYDAVVTSLSSQIERLEKQKLEQIIHDHRLSQIRVIHAPEREEPTHLQTLRAFGFIPKHRQNQN